jgi:hypothetical protein
VQAETEQPRNSPLQTLQVFKDDPLFAHSKFDVELDVFNHEAFAETIFKLIKGNAPPLSMGLFGAWGIGKSTIVNILFSKLREDESGSFLPLYFNAWKYSGDSFRRQFLIELARQIYKDGDEHVIRLEQLNYTDVLKQSHQKGFAASVVQGIKDAFDTKIAFRGITILRLLMGYAVLALCVVLAALVRKSSPFFAALLLTTTIPAIFVWFSRIKFEDLFVFQETPIYDPKLIFPEQFEKEFASLISSDALKGKKAVIAIDDLDRCEPKLVQDVLNSMKNFLGQENCFFLVPCDDKTIVSVFSEPNQKRGYEDESLRKYFNVGLRIPPITSTDLVDFANTMARNTGIPDEVVQVAVLANCRDARKMKHFLNSFAMKYQIAKARETAELMPRIIDANLPELAKAVLIEDAYPELFAKIVENPRIYQMLERAALEQLDDSAELTSLKLASWEEDFPGLKETLKRTRDIQMAHADIFFSLKSSNQEIKVPRGRELKTAVIEGNDGLVDEIANGITDGAAQTATTDLLLDLLKRSSGPFLHRSVAGSLRICFGVKKFSVAEAKRMATAITYALLYRDGVDLLLLPPDLMLSCAELATPSRLAEILKKYFDEIEGLKTSTPPKNLFTLVASIYQFPNERKRFSALFNAKFEDWIQSREGIETLESLSIPPELPSDERIPSEVVVSKVLSGIPGDTLIPQLPDIEGDTIRRKILLANWHEGLAAPFVQILIKILQATSSQDGYSPEMEFAISSIVLKNSLVETQEANQLWNLLPPLYNRVTDAGGKIEISRASIIFALLSTDQNVRTSSKDFLKSFWGTLSDRALRESLEFVNSIESPEAIDLKNAAIQQELDSARNERDVPNDRTAQRIALCIEHPDALQQGSIENMLIGTLDVGRDDSLSKWIEIINLHMDGLGIGFEERLSAKCLDLVQSVTYPQARQEVLLRTMVETLGKMPTDRRGQLGQHYFGLLKSSNVNTRNAAAAVLKTARSSLSNTEEVRIPITVILGDLRREINTPDLPQYRPVFEALIGQSDLFGEFEWREVADLSKRLLSQSDTPLQEFGMALTEAIPRIPEASQVEIVHLLKALEISSSDLKARAAQRLDKLASEIDLSTAARSELEERRISGE